MLRGPSGHGIADAWSSFAQGGAAGRTVHARSSRQPPDGPQTEFSRRGMRPSISVARAFRPRGLRADNVAFVTPAVDARGPPYAPRCDPSQCRRAESNVAGCSNVTK